MFIFMLKPLKKKKHLYWSLHLFTLIKKIKLFQKAGIPSFLIFYENSFFYRNFYILSEKKREEKEVFIWNNLRLS